MTKSPRDYFDVQHLKRDLRRRSVRGGAITLASQVVRGLLRLASVALLARLLTPGEFGLVAMATAFTSFLLLFREMGLSTATVQRDEVNHGQISVLFWINVCMGLVIALALAALARPIAWFYGAPEVENIVLVLAIGVPIGGLAVQHRALLQRQMRFGTLGVIEIVSLTAGTLAAIALAVAGGGYWALVALPLSTELVSTIGTWIACGWRPGLPRRGAGIRGMLRFGGNLAGFQFVNYIARNADNVLIGKFLGADPLGQYSRAYGLLMLPLRHVNAPLAAVAVPALSRLTDNPERYRRSYCDVVEKMQMLVVPGVAFLIVCADWVIFVLLGPQWREAAHIFAFLGLAGITQCLGNTTGWLFMSQGRGGDMLRWGLIGGTISVASFIIGLPWGAVGVAAAYAISGVTLRAPLLFWFVTRRGPVTQAQLYRTLQRPLLAACIVALALCAMRTLRLVENPIGGLAISLAVTLVLTLAVYMTDRIARKHLFELRDMLFGWRPGSNPAGLH